MLAKDFLESIGYHIKERFESASCLVFRATKAHDTETKNYAVKVPKSSWSYKHLQREREVLEAAHGLPCIASLVEFRSSLHGVDSGAVVKNFVGTLFCDQPSAYIYSKTALVQNFIEGPLFYNAPILSREEYERFEGTVRALHGFGFVDLDIAEKNTRLSKNGRLFLLDVGLAKRTGELSSAVYTARKMQDLDDMYSLLWMYTNLKRGIAHAC